VTRHRPLGLLIAALLLCQTGALALRAPAPAAAPSLVAPSGHSDAVDADVPAQEPPAAPLIGAHYHVWYPSNFDQGFLRSALDPPQQPALGRYRSDDPEVAEQQIEWASAAGVDFFTLDWWPSVPERNANALAGLLHADNIGDIDFATFYETWDLGFDAGREATPMDGPTIDRFVADMVELAELFFEHPSYLRIDGRPVVILYLSRTMTGDVAGAIGQVREALAELGHDVFLVGDEVFWRPLQPERMRLYDAITAYNLYESEKPEHRGYASQTSLVADQLALYRAHAAAAGPDVPIVPTVFPGYNDRGVRPSLGHYAVPRRWAPTDPEGTLLRELIDRIARPLLDPRTPMLFVTSWNEWNEDTAIEPLAPAAPTAADVSDTDLVFTDGFSYGGGSSQLRALRDELVAVAGRVVDDGGPVPGVRVEARRRDGRLLAADVTDAAGRYTLSRWLLPAGEAVVVRAGRIAQRVTVDPDRTVKARLVAGP
jgi:glycoprotein endo-alpha-1,2-mannosidase